MVRLKMKILLINYEFPPLGGGAGNATQNIAKELVRLEQEVIVISSSFNNLTREENLNGYKLIRVKSLRKERGQSNPWEMIIFVISVIFFLSKFLKKWRPDIIIAFFSIPSGIVAYWLKKRYKINYIISLRGGDVPGFYAKNLKFYHWLTLPINKKVWQKAKSIIANSKGLQRLAQQTADQLHKKVAYIPNGVDTNIFYPLKQKGGNKFKIIFIGRLTEQKNIEMLIGAISQLSEKIKNNLKCEIIGQGPLKKKLMKMANKLKLNKIIIFLGWLDREDLPDKYREADIFILPSKDEGMPNVILEAMASGLPIIATDISGNQELVASNLNGILINNTEELTNALIKMINDEKLRINFGQQSLIKSRYYSWQKVAKQYLEICKYEY